MQPPELSKLGDASGFHRTDPRIREAGFYPGFGKGRAIAPIQKIAVTQSSLTMNNGDVAKIQVLTTAKANNLIIVSNEMSIYVASVGPLNLLPPVFVGATTDMSQWQFYGPVNGLVRADSTAATPTDGQNAYQLILRNISAGTVTVINRVRSKYIINYGGTSA